MFILVNNYFVSHGEDWKLCVGARYMEHSLSRHRGRELPPKSKKLFLKVGLLGIMFTKHHAITQEMHFPITLDTEIEWCLFQHVV